MSRRNTAIAAALSVLALGSPLITANANPLARQYYDQGFDKYDAGNYQGAIADFNKGIEIDPHNADAYYYRGNAKRDFGDYQGAIADYTKAIEINPQNAYFYEARGLTRKEVYNLEGACDDWRKVVDLGLAYRINWLNSDEGAWCRNM